ncbi:MAG TPA: 4-hydroxyphenylacetate 3-hydroxylase N-terminal domain-containing protein [Candidatus Dormibacteraeota bacterium]|nr:4-hydroxyphenylacetate 3-hydroxylase N-terminal domain-containing protein [Candidatus Dormibacteraeota bacterium]
MRRGADYIAGIRRDGRTILLDGARVEDVTAHPGFAGPTRVIASMYDSAFDKLDIGYEVDRIAHSAMWLPPRSPQDLDTRRLVHRHWAEGSFGLMGRTPDHVAAIITAFAHRRDVFDRAGTRYGDNVEAFYRKARDNDWFVSYAVTPPQVDRSKPAHLQPEPFLYPGVVAERDDGIVIRGAQMIATSAAISDYLLLSYIAPLQPGDEDYAISVVMPLNAEGLRLYPRRPYGTMATSSFDYPLSSRFDESDNLVVLRDVFIPWEHVFVHRDIGLVSAQFYETGAHVLANYQALVRFLVKMEFAAGLAIELADAHGLSAIPPVQAQLGGDVAAFCAALEALTMAAQHSPERRGGLMLPDPGIVHAGVSLQRRWVVDLMRALRELGGGGLIAMPSAESYASPETADDVNRYYRSAKLPSRERVALLKLLWDLVGTEFAGRQLQYEMFYSAAQHVADLHVFRSFDWEVGRRHVRRARELP